MTEEDLISETKEWLNDVYGAIEVRGKIFKAGDLLQFFEEYEFLEAMAESTECKRNRAI